MLKDRLLFCVVGPSGAGKTSVTKDVVRELPNLWLSVSTTSRAIREGEVEGKDYFFVTKDDFVSKINKGDFLEHAEYGGNLYGTTKSSFEEKLNQGFDVLFDVEVQGVDQIKKLYGAQVVTIFIFPESFEDLQKRLMYRGTENQESLLKRMSIAKVEVNKLLEDGFSDYLLINKDKARCVRDLRSIIIAERKKMARISSDYLSKVFS